MCWICCALQQDANTLIQMLPIRVQQKTHSSSGHARPPMLSVALAMILTMSARRFQKSILGVEWALRSTRQTTLLKELLADFARLWLGCSGWRSAYCSGWLSSNWSRACRRPGGEDRSPKVCYVGDLRKILGLFPLISSRFLDTLVSSVANQSGS